MLTYVCCHSNETSAPIAIRPIVHNWKAPLPFLQVTSGSAQ